MSDIIFLNVGDMIDWKGYVGVVADLIIDPYNQEHVALIDFANDERAIRDYPLHDGGNLVSDFRLPDDTGWWIRPAEMARHRSLDLRVISSSTTKPEYPKDELIVFKIVSLMQKSSYAVLLNGEVIIDNLKIPFDKFINAYNEEFDVRLLHPVRR